jgi:hypothetical protein
LFNTNLTGILMRLEEDRYTRFQMEVWFDYTRKSMNEIREGTMLAVPNFASDSNTTRYSILEVSSVLPVHYGLGNDLSGFPGFVVEAAQNAYRDWEEQDTEPTDDTTKIRCLAIPTNLEIIESAAGTTVGVESNLAMVGAKVHVLDTDTTNTISNLGINPQVEDVIVAGELIRDKDVKVLLRVEDLLKVHFGIFGFTGAGKSNLLSTIIYKLLNQTRQPIKIVLFDLMGEYTALLIDLLCQLPKAKLIGLGEKTFPGSVVNYLADPANTDIRKATLDMLNSTLLPKQLKSQQQDFTAPLQNLLTTNKIRIYREKNPTLGEFVSSIESDIIKGNMGNAKQQVIDCVEKMKASEKPFTEELIQKTAAYLDKFKNDLSTTTARGNIDKLKNAIITEGQKYISLKPLPPEAIITIPALIREINDPEESGLYIIQAHDPDDLRHFSWMLGTFSYEERRRSGQITPLVSFIFDEADEFIPQGAKDTYAESTDIAMTLARRGRKFGLGIGIATQRVTYLNTSIMAQPHTYFVSKLPRKSDQERITDAFGIGDDMFRQTFKFKKGNWLLVSHDATGLDAIPLPIYVENANDRISKFLESS